MTPRIRDVYGVITSVRRAADTHFEVMFLCCTSHKQGGGLFMQVGVTFINARIRTRFVQNVQRQTGVCLFMFLLFSSFKKYRAFSFTKENKGLDKIFYLFLNIISSSFFTNFATLVKPTVSCHKTLFSIYLFLYNNTYWKLVFLVGKI